VRSVAARLLLAFSTLALFTVAAQAAKPAAQTPMLTRALLFAQPQVRSPLLSPDGKTISAVKPLNGIMNYFVAPLDKPTEWRAVTHYTDRDVNPTDVSDSLMYYWTADSRYLVFLRDHNGNEKFHVNRVDVTTGDVVDLTPGDGVRAYI